MQSPKVANQYIADLQRHGAQLDCPAFNGLYCCFPWHAISARRDFNRAERRRYRDKPKVTASVYIGSKTPGTSSNNGR
jgi:hypothetical protein